MFIGVVKNENVAVEKLGGISTVSKVCKFHMAWIGCVCNEALVGTGHMRYRVFCLSKYSTIVCVISHPKYHVPKCSLPILLHVKGEHVISIDRCHDVEQGAAQGSC